VQITDTQPGVRVLLSHPLTSPVPPPRG
jgi:hypothetical protein